SFLAKWGASPLSDLSEYVHRSMPPVTPGGLPDESYAALIALIMHENGGNSLGPLNGGQLALPLPPVAARPAAAVGGLSERLYPLPPGPTIPDRFAGYTPVTEAELANPAPEDWPAWRRSHLGLGYSPLDQIDTANVANLRIAWAQALPAGVNMNEPLVRDGVLYVFGYGDQVFAFDAASGRQLWRYQRKLAEGTPLNSRKTIALYGDKLYTATSDNHMVALDARTGEPVWDSAIPGSEGMRIPGE